MRFLLVLELLNSFCNNYKIFTFLHGSERLQGIDPLRSEQVDRKENRLTGLTPVDDIPRAAYTIGHDIIVIGASAGGRETLSRLLESLAGDLPAAVLVVLHLPPESRGEVHKILDRAGQLSVIQACDGDLIQPGRVYVAPPDVHLLMCANDHLGLFRGPRENRSRPAIDPLFRSAAVHYGSRVIGVVLSGLLDDGKAGLQAIKRCGGLAVVQDPNDALYPDMPRNSLNAVDVDYCVPVAEMGLLLDRLCRETAPPAPPVPEDIQAETHLAEQISGHVNDYDWGKPVALSCPDCGGPLWEMENKQLRRYRCHMGHGFSTRSLLAEQNVALEEALWIALRTLEERVSLLTTMIRDVKNPGSVSSSLEDRRQEAQKHVQTMRQLIQGLSRQEAD